MELNGYFQAKALTFSCNVKIFQMMCVRLFGGETKKFFGDLRCQWRMGNDTEQFDDVLGGGVFPGGQ